MFYSPQPTKINNLRMRITLRLGYLKTDSLDRIRRNIKNALKITRMTGDKFDFNEVQNFFKKDYVTTGILN